MRKIYLAGPDIFLPNGREIGDLKIRLCAEFGFEGLYPLDNGADLTDALDIFKGDVALMRRADIGLFNLTPFRGPSADAGTVFELGFMYALGKQVIGYSAVPGPYHLRVESPDGGKHDRDGLEIEDFGRADNLMLTEAITSTGGAFIADDEAGRATLAALGAFRRALQALAAI